MTRDEYARMRFDAACEAMRAIKANSSYSPQDDHECALWAVDQADALLAALGIERPDDTVAHEPPKPRVEYRAVQISGHQLWSVWAFVNGKDRDTFCTGMWEEQAQRIARLLNEDEARIAAASGTTGD